MKIIVQGNCQSRPITTLMSSACPAAELMTPIVTQLRTDADRVNDYQAFSEADVIFAQWVSDTYHVSHLATSSLKSEFGDKVITWPNAFFIGQNPDVVSISTDASSRIVGPLDTYHIRAIFKHWVTGQSEQNCLNSIRNSTESSNNIYDSILFSLNELKNRESILDVRIADFVEEHWLNKKLFHVFNHPTNILLVELVNRLCDYANISDRVPISPDFWPEYLNRVIAPCMPAINKKLGIEFDMTTSSKGFSLNYAADGGVSLGEVAIHSLENLVSQFYKAYDAQITIGESYKFTPRYLHEDYNLEKAA